MKNGKKCLRISNNFLVAFVIGVFLSQYGCCALLINHIKEICHIFFPSHNVLPQRRKNTGKLKIGHDKNELILLIFKNITVWANDFVIPWCFLFFDFLIFYAKIRFSMAICQSLFSEPQTAHFDDFFVLISLDLVGICEKSSSRLWATQRSWNLRS